MFVKFEDARRRTPVQHSFPATIVRSTKHSRTGFQRSTHFDPMPPTQLNGPLFIVTVFGTLALGRLVSLAVPTDFYFTFQSLFSDKSTQGQILSLLVKMAPPLLIGVAVGLWLTTARRSGRTLKGAALARRIRVQASPTVFAGGLFSAFLSAWPAIAYWDLLANPELAHFKAAFFGLYLLYMFAFAYITVLGTLLGVYVVEHSRNGVPDKDSVSMRELSRIGALWLLNSSLATAAMKHLTG